MSTQNQHKDGRQSNIQRTSTVIKRIDPNQMRNSNRLSGSYNMHSTMLPGTLQAMSATGVTDIKGTRQREKKDLQGLNERFANYIDKVHFLEANCKRLEAENEALRNRKEADLEPIRKAYENELLQARKTIDDLTGSKGEVESQITGFREELDDVRDLNKTLEKQLADTQKRLDACSSQIGEYEGELATLRHRISSLEDENLKVRELLKKVQDQNRKLRADLDTETTAHIEADGICQTKTEECQFYKDLLDEFELLKPEPVQIKGMDYNEFWKSEMQKALRKINEAYDDKLDTMQADMDAKYNIQINAFKSGSAKDNMAMERATGEVSKLKSQLASKNISNAELSTKVAALLAERDELNRQKEELERELEALELKYRTDVGSLQNELTNVMEAMKTLKDTKLSMELEIACYKKLLEGEETRVGLRSLVEDSLGSQKKGAVQNALDNALREEQNSTIKESTGQMTLQRSSKGAIAFKSMDHSGGNIVIENTSSGSRAKSQNLRNWKLIKYAAGRNTVEIALKDFVLDVGKTFTLWASGAKEKATDDNEQIASNFSFGVGSCKWSIYDDKESEKASITAKFSG